MASLQLSLPKRAATYALTRHRTRRLGVNPSERFLGVEMADHVDSPEGIARNNIGLDGNIPRLYQLAAMRMRFVLDRTFDPVARSWSVIAFGLRRLSPPYSCRVFHSLRVFFNSSLAPIDRWMALGKIDTFAVQSNIRSSTRL
jgi:hypothetical protein